MEKTQEILKHLFDLYNETEYTEEETINWCEKNLERYNAWDEAFRDYDTVDVFNAIDHYWRYNSNKVKPTVAKILATLQTNNAKKIEHEEVKNYRYFNPATEYMQRDMKLGICKHTLGDYNRAVSAILSRLEDMIPPQELQNMDFSTKWQNAVAKGLVGDFDDVLERVACGGEVQQKQGNDKLDGFNSAGAILAGHWGVD